MLRLTTALVAGLILALGVAACGGGNSETSDVIPKSTPDLVAPKDTSLPAVVSTATTANTVTTPTAVAPATTTPAVSGTSGGTASGGGTSSGGTGTSNSSGGFGTFCQQNPGAC